MPPLATHSDGGKNADNIPEDGARHGRELPAVSAGKRRMDR
jgi:hypothetical protein